MMMANSFCVICEAPIEQPYEGMMMITREWDEEEDEEVMEYAVLCSYCWPKIEDSIRRRRNKLWKKVKMSDYIDGVEDV